MFAAASLGGRPGPRLDGVVAAYARHFYRAAEYAACRPPDDDGRAKGWRYKRELGVPQPTAQDNFTDPGGRIMRRARPSEVPESKWSGAGRFDQAQWRFVGLHFESKRWSLAAAFIGSARSASRRVTTS